MLLPRNGSLIARTDVPSDSQNADPRTNGPSMRRTTADKCTSRTPDNYTSRAPPIRRPEGSPHVRSISYPLQVSAAPCIINRMRFNQEFAIYSYPLPKICFRSDTAPRPFQGTHVHARDILKEADVPIFILVPFWPHVWYIHLLTPFREYY